MEKIGNPPSQPKRAMFGSNKHEGSFVLGSESNFSRLENQSLPISNNDEVSLFQQIFSLPKQLPWFQSFSIAVIYNSYLVPNSVMTDEHFLRHLFSSTLLEALGLKDDSGVIYELINYRFKIESNNFC